MQVANTPVKFVIKSLAFISLFWISWLLVFRPLTHVASFTPGPQGLLQKHDAIDEKYEQQLKMAEEQLAKSQEQQRRMEALLNRYEKQATRYEALLDRWENQPAPRR